MTRVTLDNPNVNSPVCDRYFVKLHGPTSYDEIDKGVVEAELALHETEETGRPLVEILADLRIAGSL